MSRRSLIAHLSLALALLTAAGGCNGPTQTGIDARINAQSRLDMVNAEITYDQAVRNFETGRFDQARRQIEATLARAPEEPKFLILHARILMETHRLELAAKSLAKAVEVDPNNHEAHYFEGIVYQRWSEDEKAYEAYLEASTIDPSNAQYLLAAAESLVALNRLEDAQQLIRPRLNYFEHNAALHHLLAQVAMLEGRHSEAADLYGRAVLLNPEDDLIVEEMARALYAAGRYGKCLDAVEQVNERIGMKRTDMMHLEARCLTMLGRNIEARNLYLKLADLRPGDANVWAELGMLAWDQDDDRRIQQCAVRVMALAPERYEGYALMGIHERNTGNDAAALKMFRQAASRAQDSAMPHLLLGRQLESAGDADDALAAYAVALRIEPDNETAQTLFNRIDPSSRITAVPDR